MLKVRFNNNEKLLKVLKTAENILNSITTEIKFIKLSNIKNKLQITAINPTMRLYYLMDVDSIEGDSVLYDYKKLLALLNVIKGAVIIENGDIKSTKCTYKIPYEVNIDYPDDTIPAMNNKKINTAEFLKALENVNLAAEKEFIGITNGIHIGENKLIACDNKRVAIENIEIDESIQNITLPKELIKEVLRLPFGDEIMISSFGQRVIVQDDNIQIISSKLSDKYPLVEKILPHDIKYTITLKNKDMYDALISVVPLINETTKMCYLEYDNKQMNIYVENGLNSAKTSIYIRSNVEEKIEVKFNIQLLLDMLKANNENLSIITYNDNVGYRFGSTNKGFQYIMPLIN